MKSINEQLRDILQISKNFYTFPDECLRMEIAEYLESEKKYKENYDKAFGQSVDMSVVNDSSYTTKEHKMSTSINWKSSNKQLSFKDLQLGDHFKIDTPHSKGAVYRKVLLNTHFTQNTTMSPVKNKEQYAQLEVSEAEVFPPTESPVVLVEVEMTIMSPKPSFY